MADLEPDPAPENTTAPTLVSRPIIVKYKKILFFIAQIIFLKDFAEKG